MSLMGCCSVVSSFISWINEAFKLTLYSIINPIDFHWLCGKLKHVRGVVV